MSVPPLKVPLRFHPAPSAPSAPFASATSGSPAIVPRDWRIRWRSETHTERSGGKVVNDGDDGHKDEDEDEETLGFDDEEADGWLSCAAASSSAAASAIDVAIGTRGGSVYVLRGPSSPTLEPGLAKGQTTPQRRRASHSSQVSVSSQHAQLLASPTSPHADTEGAGTSTSKTSALAELVEEHNHNGQGGVEEKLEAQWHHGNPNAATVVGNVMGALGIPQHHSHGHGHGHSPPLSHLAASASSSVPGSGAHSPSRRKVSNANSRSHSPLPWVSPPNAVVEGQQTGGGAAKSEKGPSAWSLRMQLQTPSTYPVVDVILDKQRRVIALQQDGLLCAWALEDGSLDRSLDLGLTTSYPHVPPPTPAHLATPAPSGPLATLAALRASASSPAPRSRRNSNAGEQPPAPIKKARIECCFTNLVKIRTETAGDVGWVALDACRPNSWIRLDEEASKVVGVYQVQGGRVVGISPSHVYVLSEDGTLAAHRPSMSTEAEKLGKLHPSTCRGVVELEDSADGEKLLVVWFRDELRLLKRSGLAQVGDSMSCRSTQQVSVSGQTVCVQSTRSALLLQVRPSKGLQRSGAMARTAILASGLPFVLEQDERDCVSLTDERGRQLWKGNAPESPRLGCLLPLSMERIVVALPSGHLGLASLAELAMGKVPAAKDDGDGAPGTVCLLETVVNTRTQTKHIVAATKEGDVAFYDVNSLQLQVVHSLLTSPVVRLFVLDAEGPRLKGCMAAVGADGTVAVFLLDGLKHLYVIPGCASPLERMAVRGNEILLLYRDGRARIWDMVSLELRRSIDLQQALSLVDEIDPSSGSSAWIQHLVSPMDREEPTTQGVLSRSLDESSVLADIRRAIEAATHRLETTKIVQILRPLVRSLSSFSNKCWSELLTQADGPAQEGLHVEWGTYSPPRDFFARTKESTTRVLALLSILFVLRNNVARLKGVVEACIQDLTAPKSAVGPDRLCLATLAAYTMDPLDEVQEAARQLFLGPHGLQPMEQPAVDALCEMYAPRLPVKHAKLYPQADSITSLSLLGFIATQRYNALSPSVLKDISTSISLLVSSSTTGTEEEASPQVRSPPDSRGQAVAIDLCCQGFSIWQHYFDAMEVVRTLFALSTTPSSSPPNGTSAFEGAADDANRALARRATLQIAQDNTPLFMTTLSLDILHARSASHCGATMRLVAFMVRKKPSVLYPNLPRLAEAVVKSLDPTNSARRESVSGSATLMISELVRAYPSISFCGKLQRLAVGTHEGAVILYDLKTATRLYVIEAQSSLGASQRLTAVDFSPDGRRLVTVSSTNTAVVGAQGGKGSVSVWKVGGGFSTFFQPGTLPKQGGAEGEAYKSVEFHAVPKRRPMKRQEVKRENIEKEEDEEEEEDGEEWQGVKVEWPSERNVRISVGESQISLDVA